MHDIPKCILHYLYSLRTGTTVSVLLRGRKTYVRGITYESLDISDTAYNCEWYSLPPKNARLLMIIMCRAVASPLKLTAGKFCWFTILLYSQI
ncbi:hypothetical protein E2986_11810 [Frieseomelitta varia]|uniref:Uncharacterized protein n=1 Tax=Frieseomelitta varia TaxID=561572 RepID=A0A833VM12_9HYME|nr:hypothetical protein E2986_11810 [Frieseomelitta varia]